VAENALDVSAHLDAPKDLERLIVRACLDEREELCICLILSLEDVVSAFDGLALFTGQIVIIGRLWGDYLVFRSSPRHNDK
jgi:hypothetical protein